MVAFFKDLYAMTVNLLKKVPKKTYELVAIVLVAVILLVDLGYHLSSAMEDTLETAPAKISEMHETKTLDCLLLREEKPIFLPSDRYLFLCEEGERVRVGTELVRCYADTVSEEDIASLAAELELKKLLEGAATSRPEKVRTALEVKIEGIMLRIDRAMTTGNVALASHEEKTLAAMMLLRERLLGTLSLDALREEADKRILSLEARLGKPIAVITADAVGWFSPNADGYESVLSSEGLFSLDGASLSALFDQKPQSPAPCKLILSYETYAIAETDEITARRFSQNARYQVTAEGLSLSLTLQKTVVENQRRDAVLIFSTQALSETLPLRRIFSLTLTLKTHTGFKVPTACIQELDGVYGVYILKGFRVEFREISIIYREGATAVLAVKFEPEAYRILAENDHIIIKGEELYDGKIVS